MAFSSHSQGRSLVQSTNDLLSLVNRVNMMQRENEKLEKKNFRTVKQTNKIFEVRQNKYDSLHQIHEAQQQADLELDSQRTKHKLQVEQYKKERQMNKRQRFVSIENKDKISLKDKVYEQLSAFKLEQEKKKSLAYANSRIRLAIQKQNIQGFWNNRLEQCRQAKTNEKNHSNQQCYLQDQSISKLESMELKLIENLQVSQKLSEALRSQLEAAMTLSHQEFKLIYHQTNVRKDKISQPGSNIQSRLINKVNYNNFDGLDHLPIIAKFPQKNPLNPKELDKPHHDRQSIKKIYSNPISIKCVTYKTQQFKRKWQGAQTDRLDSMQMKQQQNNKTIYQDIAVGQIIDRKESDSNLSQRNTNVLHSVHEDDNLLQNDEDKNIAMADQEVLNQDVSSISSKPNFAIQEDKGESEQRGFE